MGKWCSACERGCHNTIGDLMEKKGFAERACILCPMGLSREGWMGNTSTVWGGWIRAKKGEGDKQWLKSETNEKMGARDKTRQENKVSEKAKGTKGSGPPNGKVCVDHNRHGRKKGKRVRGRRVEPQHGYRARPASDYRKRERVDKCAKGKGMPSRGNTKTRTTTT